jgi:hypothetical protein
VRLAFAAIGYALVMFFVLCVLGAALSFYAWFFNWASPLAIYIYVGVAGSVSLAWGGATAVTDEETRILRELAAELKTERVR